MGGFNFMKKTNTGKIAPSALGKFKVTNSTVGSRMGPSALGSRMSMTSDQVASNADIDRYVQQKLKEQKDKLDKFQEANSKRIKFQTEQDSIAFVHKASKDILHAVNKEYQ